MTLDEGVDDVLPVVEPPMSVSLLIADMPTLTDSAPGLTCLVFGASTFNPDSEKVWAGYRVYSSRDDVTYTFLFECSERAVTGLATPPIAAVATNYTWDYQSVLTVTLDRDDDELQSLPEEDVLTDGKNMLLVGQEIIQFVTATLVDDRTYELTQLRRGCRGTENYISSHPDDVREAVLLLSGPGIVYKEFQAAHNATRYFRVVPPSLTADDAIATYRVTLTSETRRPFSAYAVRAVRNAAGDLTVTWARRTRNCLRTLSGSSAPMDEAVETFEVDVRDDADTETVATYDSSPQIVGASFVYTAAEQTTDYGAPKASLRIRIYQWSDFLGRGYYRSIVV